MCIRRIRINSLVEVSLADVHSAVTKKNYIFHKTLFSGNNLITTTVKNDCCIIEEYELTHLL